MILYDRQVRLRRPFFESLISTANGPPSHSALHLKHYRYLSTHTIRLAANTSSLIHTIITTCYRIKRSSTPPPPNRPFPGRTFKTLPAEAPETRTSITTEDTRSTPSTANSSVSRTPTATRSQDSYATLRKPPGKEPHPDFLASVYGTQLGQRAPSDQYPLFARLTP